MTATLFGCAAGAATSAPTPVYLPPATNAVICMPKGLVVAVPVRDEVERYAGLTVDAVDVTVAAVETDKPDASPPRRVS